MCPRSFHTQMNWKDLFSSQPWWEDNQGSEISLLINYDNKCRGSLRLNDQNWQYYYDVKRNSPQLKICRAVEPDYSDIE